MKEIKIAVQGNKAALLGNVDLVAGTIGLTCKFYFDDSWKDLNKTIRKINKDLAALGYEDKELSTRVLQNLDFARANMKANIYDQAVLEGVATSFPQTEDIIENGQVNGVSAIDVQKILNVSSATATRTLSKFAKNGKLKRVRIESHWGYIK